MSRFVKLLAGALTIALTAALVGVVAYDRGRDDRQAGPVRYQLRLDSESPVVASTIRGFTVQAPLRSYRVRLAPSTVIELGSRPNCRW